MTRFRSSAGRVEAHPDDWGLVAVQVSALARMHKRIEGVWPVALLELVQAMEAAQRGDATRAVSRTEPGRRAGGSVLLTAGEAATRMGCSVQYVRRLARSGRIGAVRHGRAWAIDPATVDRQAGTR